jgi:protein SCO1/2
MAPRTRILIAALVGIALLAGVGAALIGRNRAAPELATGTYLSHGRGLPQFSLIDQNGRAFATGDLRGSWSMMFFGYTNCPDFCPATLSTLAAMEQRMRAAGASVLPRVIFISVDAKRDTPAQLARYVPYFDPSFVGLTAADQPAIEAVAAKLGVTIGIEPGKGDDYTVDHTAAIFVLDPDGRLRAILTGPFTVAALQRDFERIVAARS